MDIENRASALDIRPIEDDLPVEPARPQQCGIEHVRPVGGRDHDHVRAAVEPVHLDQDLVECLLALVVAAAETGAALATDRVDLIDEDDARRALLGLVEEIADPARADADEHLDEFGTGDAEERHAGLAGDRAREQCFARARGPDQQHATRNAGAERLNFPGYLRNSTTSTSSSLASSTPATSEKVTVGLLPVKRRARLLPNDIAWLLLPWAWRIMKTKMPIRKSVGRKKPSAPSQPPHRLAGSNSIRPGGRSDALMP